MPSHSGRWSAAIVLAAVLASPIAGAAARPFTWGYDTEIVSEGNVELENWLWARSFPANQPTTPVKFWIWWGPVIGITDHLELALPFQVESPSGGPAVLDSFEADFRYRIFSRLDRSPFQMLVRGVFHQAIGFAGSPNGFSRVDADLVASYTFESGLHLQLDLGSKLGLPGLSDSPLPAEWQGTCDFGAAYPVSDELKIAAELFGEYPLANFPQPAHQFIGPAVEWTRGRFWLTAGVLFGLTPLLPNSPIAMPRVLWAVSL